ncbi:MAG: hypothetical protein KC621_17815 [Myxococcales bacterium]|nr:hypothetical protein [Myxococcales bacterium]
MILWLALGCGESPDPAGELPSLPACAPWDAWAPLAEGRIVHCDERRLHARFPAGQADALAPGWREAVTGAGWVEALDTSAPGLVAVRYRDGERTLALTLVDTPRATELAATVTAP